MGALNVKGIREKHLHESLLHHIKLETIMLESNDSNEEKNGENSISTSIKHDNQEKINEILAGLISFKKEDEEHKKLTRNRNKKSGGKKLLSCDLVIENLLSTEAIFQDYLENRMSRWTSEQERNEIVKININLIIE